MDSMNGTNPSLLQLLDVHTLLEDLLLAHQTALLDRNLPAAAHWLQQFDSQLRQHIADEEAWILPVYAEHIDPPEGAKLIFFQSEHEKLLKSLDELHARLMAIEPAGTPLQFGDILAPPAPSQISAREIIALLDRESSFKDLLQHHDARERTFLYPLLAAHLPDTAQREILERVVLGGSTA